MELRNIILVVVFIFGLVYMQFINAETVDEIISRHAEARGGIDKFKNLSSIYMEGIRQMMGNNVIIKVTKVNNALYRNDFTFGNISGYTIVTPNAGWSLIPMRNEKAESISSKILKHMQSDMDIEGPLINYAAKKYKAKLQGKEIIEGRNAYKIKLSSTDKDITYYIDTKTYLVIQSKEMRPSHSDDSMKKEVITNFSNYQFVDEILFPFTISNPGDSAGAGSITFTKIELNKQIDQSQYFPS